MAASRGSKQNTHGGGIRDPLIVRWPKRIRDQGGIRRQFHHVCDLTPTVLDARGITPPAAIGGVSQQPLEGSSLVYSFDAPDAPTPKEAQYFEMLGHRGIWHRGWKAVTWHHPRTNFDEDQWELYHVDEDFNEVHDLADERPEKLREMIDRWWIEAGRYHVLPLIGLQNRFSVASPHTLGKRSRQVLLPGGQRIPGSAAPDLRNRSFTITAEALIADGGAEGVIVAQGDWCGGYAMYVKDGHLVFDYNFVGQHHVATSSAPLSEGPATLRFELTKTGPFCGHGTLYINGDTMGHVDIPQMYRGLMSFTGLEVGRASPPEVSDFKAPFAFTGTLYPVVYDLGDDQDADEAAAGAAAMRRQ